MNARLTADLWVSAYLNRLRLANIAHYMVAKGDPTAGAVVVKLATLGPRRREMRYWPASACATVIFG